MEGSKELSNKLAEALVEIDPDMKNRAEGISFIKKIYKLKNKKAPSVKPTFPSTPVACVEMVAGKVIQVEDLEMRISEANSFRDFFAHVYCAAYVNALVTKKDGLV